MINVTWRDGQYDRHIIFNPPEVLESPDYSGYWLKFSEWTKDNAALLLCNICPSVLNYAASLESIAECLETPRELKLLLSNIISSLEKALLSEAVKVRYEGKPENYTPVLPELPPKTSTFYPLALHGAIAEALEGAMFKPKDVVQWAQSKGFEIPEPLKVLLDKNPVAKKKPGRKKKPLYPADFTAEFNKLWKVAVFHKYDKKKLITWHKKNSFAIITGLMLDNNDLYKGIKKPDGNADHNAKETFKRRLWKMIKKEQQKKT
jgi:hypothetical protein